MLGAVVIVESASQDPAWAALAGVMVGAVLGSIAEKPGSGARCCGSSFLVDGLRPA
jgi:hypothetical protein